MLAYLAKNKGRFLAFFIGVFLVDVAIWIKIRLGIATVDEVISTIYFSANGLLNIDKDILFEFLSCFLFPFILIPALLFTEKYVLQFLPINHAKKFFSIVPGFIILSGLLSIAYVFSLKDYAASLFIDNKDNNDYFYKQYRNPNSVEFSTKKTNNLIVIYVEGLESTYSQEQFFGRDLLAKLHHLKINSISFDQFAQVGGASWSIAGLVSSQCGVPLKSISIFGLDLSFQATRQFLSNATCLSDILAANGYENVFLQGSDLRFQGFDNFLKSHHYDTTYGKDEWLDKGIKKDEMIGWGLPDDLLFKNAKSTLTKLIAKKKPFNLTIFTVDTHGPKGSLNKSCRQRGGQDFNDIVECTASEVADFIHYVEQRGWLNQLTIVVMGDHLAMGNPAMSQLKSSPNRYVFNLIIGAKELSKNTNAIVHFDMFPTILSAIGFEFNGDGLALGRTAIGSGTADAFAERYAKLNMIYNYPSRAYKELWRKRQNHDEAK